MIFKNKFLACSISLTLILSIVAATPIYALSADKGLLFFQDTKGNISKSVSLPKESKFKVSLKNLAKNSVRFEIKEGLETFGFIEVQNDSNSVKTKFIPLSEDSLNIEVFKHSTGVSKRAKNFISLNFKNQKIALSLSQIETGKGTSDKTKSGLQKILYSIQNDSKLSKLLNVAQHLSLIDDDPGVECITRVVECGTAVVGWVGAMAALLVACPLTVGWTCLGVLVAHPIFAAGVGVFCGTIGKKCQQDKKLKPVSDDFGFDFEIIF